MNRKIKIYTDGGARGNPGPAACAFVAKDNRDQVIFQSSLLLGVTTNNVAEYSGVLLALRWLKQNIKYMEPADIEFFLDSQLITYQLTGKFKIKHPSLVKLHQTALSLIEEIKSINKSDIKFGCIPRSQNSFADSLLNELLDKKLN